MDTRLLKLLACPLCQGKLLYDYQEQELICRYDKLAYPVIDNVPIISSYRARPILDKEV